MSGKKSVVRFDEFKGHKMIKIFETDGEFIDKYPVINVGVRKAKAIIRHIKDLEKFVKENEGKEDET